MTSSVQKFPHDSLGTVNRLKKKGVVHMIGNKSLVWIGVCLTVTIFIAGCTSPSAPAPIQTQAPTTVIQTIPPTTLEATTVPVNTTVVTPKPTETIVEKEILHDTGTLTTESYKTYDFKEMGFKFVYPGDKFRITIKAEKPILGYALNTEQASQLQGLGLIPHYETYSTKVQWGLIDPSFVLEKATNSTEEFIYGDYVDYRYDGIRYVEIIKTKGEVHPLTYVVDGRWMSYDPVYDNVPPFTYEITITKTGGPTKQSFDF
jgi:hypothetical protein